VAVGTQPGFGAAQTSQSKPIEFENALHVGKPHLDLLALSAGLLERLCIAQRTDVLTHLFIEVTSQFAHDCRRALRLQGAGRAVIFVGSIVDDAALIDIAGAGEFRPARADVDVALTNSRPKGEILTLEPAPSQLAASFASTGNGMKPMPREPSLAVGSKPAAPTSGQSEKKLTGRSYSAEIVSSQ
jgi:hypothetical protein